MKAIIDDDEQLRKRPQQAYNFRPLGLGGGSAAIEESDPIGDALRADMVAYWKFEEASGTRVDATGNGHNATPTNAPASAIGKSGNAVHFSRASSQYATVAHHADLQNSSNIYLFGWIKILSQADFINSYGYTFIAKMDADTGHTEYEVYYARYVEPDNETINFYMQNEIDGQTCLLSITGSLFDWHFFEAYYRASDRQMGLAIDNGSFTTINLENDVDLTTAPVLIGTDPYIAFETNYMADTYQDEFGIMKPVTVPITQEQRDYLYNSGNGRTLYP